MQLISKHFLLIASILTVSVCAFVAFSVAPHSAHGATATQTSKATTSTKKVTTTKKITAKKVVAPKIAFEYSGWIPYWRTATGTADVYPHLQALWQVHPFGYTVKKDGTLYDASNFEVAGTWDAFRAEAKKQKTKMVPSVMWSDGATIDAILRDPIARLKHVEAIADMVARTEADGVDIDYEGKFADTRDSYSLFLKELKAKIGAKMLSCTIEARTPPDSLYANIPADIEYANDFKEINKYCDRVKLMTYDQQNADIKLNKLGDRLYSPVADPLWVKKVIDFTAKDIAKSKIVMGVATYGYIYHVTPDSNGINYTIDKQEAFNPRYATELAATMNITPIRNRAGELYFTYVGADIAGEGGASQATLALAAPTGTPSALQASEGAMALQKKTGQQESFYMLWWSDAQAVADKVALAKKLGIRGVAVFKFDGGEDQGIWQVLK